MQWSSEIYSEADDDTLPLRTVDPELDDLELTFPANADGEVTIKMDYDSSSSTDVQFTITGYTFSGDVITICTGSEVTNVRSIFFRRLHSLH